MHETELLQMSWPAKQDIRSKLVMWLLQPIVFSQRQNNSSSYFASWGKIDTEQKMYVVHHNTLSDSFRIRIIWFQPEEDSDRIRISYFKNRIGSDSKNPLSDRLWYRHADDPLALSFLEIQHIKEFFVNSIHVLSLWFVSVAELLRFEVVVTGERVGEKHLSA